MPPTALLKNADAEEERGGQKVQLDLIISTEKSHKQGIQCILYTV